MMLFYIIQMIFLRTLQDIKSKNFDASISAYIDTQLGKILYKSGIKKKSCTSNKISSILLQQTYKTKKK